MQDTNTAVAAEVRAAIARAGLTQSEVARRADIAANTLSAKIRGIRGFSVDELIRIAHALDIEPSSLIPSAQAAA